MQIFNFISRENLIYSQNPNSSSMQRDSTDQTFTAF